VKTTQFKEPALPKIALELHCLKNKSNEKNPVNHCRYVAEDTI
jgi:hypothetical protein